MKTELVPLQDMQRLFVLAYVANGAKQEKAALTAGYSEKSARSIAWGLMDKAHILAAIGAERRRVLGGEIGTLALNVLRGILKDADEKGSVRLDAAKAALALAGHIAPKAPEIEPDKGDRPMADWTAGELEDFIRKGQAALDGAAKPLIAGECKEI